MVHCRDNALHLCNIVLVGPIFSCRVSLRVDYSRAVAPYDDAETSATSSSLMMEYFKAVVLYHGARTSGTSFPSMVHDVAEVPASCYSTIALEYSILERCDLVEVPAPSCSMSGTPGGGLLKGDDTVQLRGDLRHIVPPEGRLLAGGCTVRRRRDPHHIVPPDGGVLEGGDTV